MNRTVLALTLLVASAYAGPTTAAQIQLPAGATLEACALAQVEAAIAESRFPAVRIDRVAPKTDLFGETDYFKVYATLAGHPVKGWVYPHLRRSWSLDAEGQRQSGKVCVLEATLLCRPRLQLRNATGDTLVSALGECLP